MRSETVNRVREEIEGRRERYLIKGGRERRESENKESKKIKRRERAR